MEVKLIVQGGKNHGREVPLSGNKFLIGRGEDCQLRPASDRVSRKHCILRTEEGRVFICDLGSTNHTFVNKEKITGERELKNGDVVNVGGILNLEVQFTVELASKKKPKVNSVQEAAVRTVENAATDDVDISRWLEDNGTTPPPVPHGDPKLANTQIEQSLSDTTTIVPTPKTEEKKDDKKKQEKSGGPIDKKKKPMAQNSQVAAEDTLRQFFGRKR